MKYVLTILLIQESRTFDFKFSQEAKCNKASTFYLKNGGFAELFSRIYRGYF